MSSAKDKTRDNIHVAHHDDEGGITIYDAQNKNAWICADDPVDTDAKR